MNARKGATREPPPSYRTLRALRDRNGPVDPIIGWGARRRASGGARRRVLSVARPGSASYATGVKGRKLIGRGLRFVHFFAVCGCHRGPPGAVLITSPFHRAPRECAIGPAAAPICV